MLKLKTEMREGGSNRIAGFIPAVVYGPKMESVSISVPEVEFNKVWKSAGESTVITLESEKASFDVLIHDIARNVVTDKIIHVDFYAVDKNKTVEINVPIEFVGTAPAVKALGGVLMKVAHEITIEALPKDLPHVLEVDISSLVDFDSQITAGSITLPAGVTLVTEADEVIALVSAAKEESETDTGPVDISSIELSEKKGKKEDADGDN
jgi:large subunit ribosomal protein L25